MTYPHSFFCIHDGSPEGSYPVFKVKEIALAYAKAKNLNGFKIKHISGALCVTVHEEPSRPLA